MWSGGRRPREERDARIDGITIRHLSSKLREIDVGGERLGDPRVRDRDGERLARTRMDAMSKREGAPITPADVDVVRRRIGQRIPVSSFVVLPVKTLERWRGVD